MRGFAQFLCVLAIAVGAGLFSFGRYYDPRLSELNATDVTNYVLDRDESARSIGAGTRGAGIGFMILGALGLLVPWLNSRSLPQISAPNDNDARTIGTAVIWLAVATIIAFGVLRLNWSDNMVSMLVLVLLICITATVSMAFLFGWRPWTSVMHPSLTESEEDET